MLLRLQTEADAAAVASVGMGVAEAELDCRLQGWSWPQGHLAGLHSIVALEYRAATSCWPWAHR
jgi:hypothetical protein